MTTMSPKTLRFPPTFRPSERVSSVGTPLMQFRSRVAGRNANVRILTNRVEWSTARRHPVTEMLPLTAISSVSTNRNRFTRNIAVVTSRSTINFRVDKSIAEQATTLVRELLAQQPPPLADNSQQPQKGSIADELISLRWLLDAGILTEAAFNEQQAHLVGYLTPCNSPVAVTAPSLDS